MCGFEDLFFALPFSAARGFKIFSNVVLRAKSLPTSVLGHVADQATARLCLDKLFYLNSSIMA